MRSLGWLRGVAVLGILVLCSACNRAPATDNPGNVTSKATPGKRATTRAQPPAKSGRAPAKRMANGGTVGAPPVRRSEPHDAVAPNEAVVQPPINTPPPTSVTELARAVATLSAGGGCGPNAYRAFVVLRNTDAFMKADASSLRLAAIGAGVRVDGIAAEGDWRLVRFADALWGERAAYVRCSVLELAPLNIADSKSTGDSSPNANVAVRREPPSDLSVDPRQKRETVRGYLEWQKGSYIIVDGQRVRWTPGTQLQLGRLPFVSSVPPGYEVVVTGRRTRDGSLMAERIDAKPNDVALNESEVVREFDDVERDWLAKGTMFISNDKEVRTIGRILDAGPAVDRVRRIMRSIVPPLVDATRIRVHVVDSDEWNARAMGNGAIWVNTGLVNDTSDDELAIVLGHELAHYTHNHTRQRAKNAKVSLLAWVSGYSRTLEDQADRVGLRYAYEGGFDVERAIEMWSRVRSRLGDKDPVTNCFTGNHSRATDRMKNIRRELQLNYESH